MAELKMKIKTNVHELAAKIEAMGLHLETAPEDDPAKIAMLAFGKIDPEAHFQYDTRSVDGEIICDVIAAPELQRIMDMIPAARIDQ